MKEFEDMNYYELLIAKKQLEAELKKKQPYDTPMGMPKWNDPFDKKHIDYASENDWDARIERQRDAIDKAVSLANDLYYSTEDLDFAVDTACRYLGYSFMKLG